MTGHHFICRAGARRVASDSPFREQQRLRLWNVNPDFSDLKFHSPVASAIAGGAAVLLSGTMVDAATVSTGEEMMLEPKSMPCWGGGGTFGPMTP